MSFFAAKVHNSDHIRYGSRIKILLSYLQTINKVMPQKKIRLIKKNGQEILLVTELSVILQPIFSDN